MRPWTRRARLLNLTSHEICRKRIVKLMRGLLVAALVCVAQIAGAQEETAIADGALLRGLDKVSGAVHDVALRSGKSIEIGNCALRLVNVAILLQTRWGMHLRT